MVTNHFNTVSPHSAQRGASLKEVQSLHVPGIPSNTWQNVSKQRYCLEIFIIEGLGAPQHHSLVIELKIFFLKAPPKASRIKKQGVDRFKYTVGWPNAAVCQLMGHEPSFLSESATSTCQVPEAPDEEWLKFSTNFFLKSQGSTLWLFTSFRQLLLTVVASGSCNRLWRYESFLEALTSTDFRVCCSFSNRRKWPSLSPAYRE